jgi:hypothetical protein
MNVRNGKLSKTRDRQMGTLNDAMTAHMDCRASAVNMPYRRTYAITLTYLYRTGVFEPVGT